MHRVPIWARPSPQGLRALRTGLGRLSGNLGGLPGSCSPGRDPLTLPASPSLWAAWWLSEAGVWIRKAGRENEGPWVWLQNRGQPHFPRQGGGLEV